MRNGFLVSQTACLFRAPFADSFVPFSADSLGPFYADSYSDPDGGVSSMGRVQTPTLAMIVQRDREISGFTSRPF